MTAAQIAALPMYDFPELIATHDALWQFLAARLRQLGLSDVPAGLTRDLGHTQTWQHPGLLLGQGCEYPLAKSFSTHIRVIGTPRYSAPGCEGSCYRSAVVVRSADAADSLRALRGRRCIINERDSNSGMNLLRAIVAPVAGGRTFFSSVAISGSHRESVARVVAGEADVTALDCVTLAHLGRLQPQLTAGLRILCWTPASPCLPYITASAQSDPTVQALRTALQDVFTDPALATLRDTLLLTGIDFETDASFDRVLRLERSAAELGYPELR
jgi:ABC-type phosphate/phosphonate transport system substrate-binding protein